MRVIFCVSVAMLQTACGDRVCEKTKEDGTYRAEYTNVGGTCGDIGVVIIQVVNGQSEASAGCTTDYSRYSENNCKQESSVTCVDSVNELVSSSVGVFEQTEDDGSKYEGSITMTFRDIDTGQAICAGTYDVVMTRQ